MDLPQLILFPGVMAGLLAVFPNVFPALIEFIQPEGQSACDDRYSRNLIHPLLPMPPVRRLSQIGSKSDLKTELTEWDRRKIQFGSSSDCFFTVNMMHVFRRMRIDSSPRLINQVRSITEKKRLRRAGRRTRRHEADIDAVGAECALADQRRLRFPLKLWDLKRAGHHAVATAYASGVIVDYRAIFSLYQSSYGADACASRFIAVHALALHKIPFQHAFPVYRLEKNYARKGVAAKVSRIGACLGENGWQAGQAIPALTCDLAGAAADTARSIDQNAFAHRLIPVRALKS